MLFLKHNSLDSNDLIEIERYYLRWIDSSSTTIEVNVLDCSSTALHGYLLGILDKLQVIDTLHLSASQLLDFLIDIQKTYNDTPYHSFYHATDIVAVLYYILCDLKAKKYLTNLEISILSLAAICHDAGHTGYNNDYHVKFNTEHAIRYNSISVLESLSVDIALELLQKHHILESVQDQREKCLVWLKKLILSTDMTFHYDLLTEARALEDTFSSINLWDEESIESDMESLVVSETHSIGAGQPSSFHRQPSFLGTPLKSTLIFDHNDDLNLLDEESSVTFYSPLDEPERLSFSCILLHATDISNTVRAWPISKQWSDLIVQEFFRQGDAEKAAGLAVSPGMDRNMATQASISLKFGDFVVKPYFEALTGLLPSARVFIDQLEENREEWTKLKQSPYATSITNYYLSSRLSLKPTHIVKQNSLPVPGKVNVPAGTVALPIDSNSHRNTIAFSSSSSSVATKNSTMAKPMPILRTASHSNILLSTSSASPESYNYRRKKKINL
ncbi:uncharacterized protein B0P05DRAFT_119680 [Gilbertella persicaria]|uniref:uncharacterized protein n=1 Tax=Gilbertella persicaria TaxID=101096 RepID=UPI0022204732|nr:uncharacterized protein B0P05DRAFT_119680 [Gilbertella persicaria]KAI8077976.1 hypothetical protein B0P05DRAFT_119680 [Gilbertella persicaria]